MGVGVFAGVFSAASSVSSVVPESVASLSAIQRARITGGAMENALGMTGPKTGINVGGTMRFPDRLANGLLEESKNVKHLNFTRQLKDYLQYSQDNKLDFVLHTRPNTTFSRPLRQLIDNGTIIRNKVPGF